MEHSPRTLMHPEAAKSLATGAFLSAVAISVAFVVGNPGVTGIPVVVIALAAIGVSLLLSRVYAGFLLMVASSFLFMVVAATPNRYLNAFDLILPFMFPAALFGSLRREAEDEALRIETTPADARIREASGRFAKAGVLFFGIAVISLVPMIFRIGVNPTIDSGFALTRSIQGTLLFPLGLWWLRSEGRIQQFYWAACLGGIVLTGVSVFQRFVLETNRPGITWVLNHPSWPTEDPNQAGVSMVMLIALAFAHHAVRPRFWNYAVIAAGVVVLLLSLSRSSILAMATLLAPNLRRVRPLHAVGGLLLVGAALAVMPEEFWARMAKTVTLQHGSYELFTFLLRVYGYLTSLKIFLGNWLFGVGFLGGAHVSHDYNEMGLSRLGAENYFLETAVGLGVIGLAALVMCFVRLFQLGKVVREVSPPGTLGHHLGRLHAPMISAIMVANLTGNNLVGVIGIGQIALWAALLARAGHIAIRSGAPAADPAPRE